MNLLRSILSVTLCLMLISVTSLDAAESTPVDSVFSYSLSFKKPINKDSVRQRLERFASQYNGSVSTDSSTCSCTFKYEFKLASYDPLNSMKNISFNKNFLNILCPADISIKASESFVEVKILPSTVDISRYSKGCLNSYQSDTTLYMNNFFPLKDDESVIGVSKSDIINKLVAYETELTNEITFYIEKGKKPKPSRKDTHKLKSQLSY